MYDGDHALVTMLCETPVETGQRASAFPLDEWAEQESGRVSESPRYEVTYRGEDGAERPATTEENDEFFATFSDGVMESARHENPPCRCGRRIEDHERSYPLWAKHEGLVCFECWTPEEHKQAGPPPGAAN